MAMTFAGCGHAQTSTPEEALEELATASSVEVVLRHLPVAADEIINKLPPRTKAEVMEQLLPAKHMEAEGMKLRRAMNGRAWEVVNLANNTVDRTLEVTDTFIAGDGALLVISSTRRDQRTPEEMMVGMQLEEGDWRLAEFGHWDRKSMEGVFTEKAETGPRNEHMTVNTLQSVAAALAAYFETYPAIGFPESLASLAYSEDDSSDDGPSPEHAGLLGPPFTSNSVTVNGYEFRYASDGRSHYTITATPVEWQETGTKSFFMDESGVIRATPENRKAGPNDEPISEAELDAAEDSAVE
jgi:hypothetical protein